MGEGTPATSAPVVSVIVPCAGELDDVSALITSLRAQDAAFIWEAIFVDNNLSRDGRVRLEREIGAVEWAQIVTERTPGISPARNAGAAAARGEVLAFIDADDVASPTWLRGLVDSVAEGVIAAGRLDLEVLNPPWLARTRGANRPGTVYRCEGIYPIAPGGNMALMSQDFVRLGGLDEGWTTLEDFELCFRAWRAGLQVRDAGPLATIHYRLRRDPRVLLRQGYRYGRARARMYRRLHDEGLVGRTAPIAWRTWVLLAVRLVQGIVRDRDRAAAMWILGNRVGRLHGSWSHRVIYL